MGPSSQEKIKAVENKYDDKNDQSTSTNMFIDLIENRKNRMNKLNDDADRNKLLFKYEGSTKVINF